MEQSAAGMTQIGLTQAQIQTRLKAMKRKDRIFRFLGIFTILLAMVFLLTVILDIIIDGLPVLDLDFMTSFPSRFPAQAGILSAWVGSLAVMVIAILTSVLLGVLGGIYLEEYARKNFLTVIIEVNINNLAAVPSIIYGLLALGLFVYFFNFGRSILTGGLTLGLLMLPVVVVTTREAIRQIPQSIREAAYAVGATKWETVRDHVLPYATGGILTGVIISTARAIGETAPLITIGALTYIAFLPEAPLSAEAPFINFDWIFSPFTVLPIQMFNWVSRPQDEFQVTAAAAGIVLIVLTLLLNSLAFYIRYKLRKGIRW